jgi:hypothetical protein
MHLHCRVAPVAFGPALLENFVGRPAEERTSRDEMARLHSLDQDIGPRWGSCAALPGLRLSVWLDSAVLALKLVA